MYLVRGRGKYSRFRTTKTLKQSWIILLLENPLSFSICAEFKFKNFFVCRVGTILRVRILQVTSESVSTRQREGGSLPCSVNEVQLINFTQGAYNGDSSTRASLEDLRWSSNSSMHKLQAVGQHDRGSPKPPMAHSPVEMITFESRCVDKDSADDKKAKMSQALQMEKQTVIDKARQESERENACVFKNTVNLEVNQNEVDETEKISLLHPHDNIVKVCDLGCRMMLYFCLLWRKSARICFSCFLLMWFWKKKILLTGSTKATVNFWIWREFQIFRILHFFIKNHNNFTTNLLL